MLSKLNNLDLHYQELQEKIIKHLKKELYKKSNYKIIFNDLHIIEKNINMINQDDFIIWHPFVASNNLTLVKSFLNSIVILQNKTIFIQKISKRNLINENMAINNGFKLLYIEPNYNDITNDEWKLIIPENDYLITIEKILEINKNKILKNT